jgi:hypothetical protein
MARPGRLELPTLCLEGRRSIQLSYGRILGCSLILLLLQFQFEFQFFRNFEALWSDNWNREANAYSVRLQKVGFQFFVSMLRMGE